tara:strand:+ start:295 stop:399 length:105 start_codon:yes stop_codon:yes gene_type:complete
MTPEYIISCAPLMLAMMLVGASILCIIINALNND